MQPEYAEALDSVLHAGQNQRRRRTTRLSLMIGEMCCQAQNGFQIGSGVNLEQG